MLYFRFNKDNFVAPQIDYDVTSYISEKQVSATRKEIRTLTFGEVQNFFLEKLRNELGLAVGSKGTVIWNLLGIPVDALSIDNEQCETIEGSLRYVLQDYVKLPIAMIANKSLNDLGIYVEFIKGIPNSEIASKGAGYIHQNNLISYTEEVLWKNMTLGEKVSKYAGYLDCISSNDKELIIIDPYLFAVDSEDYREMLQEILIQAKAKTLVVITEQHHFNLSCYNRIKIAINQNITIVYDDSCHDRFWIADRMQGFCTGTSLNGVGRKLSLINFLGDDEVQDIISELISILPAIN